jgi:hypothetical protein
LRCDGAGGPAEETLTVTVLGGDDAGAPGGDGGVPSTDGGGDAGAPSPDGGGAGDGGALDAGTGRDGGPIVVTDSGTVDVDAGPQPVRPVHRWSFTAVNTDGAVPDLIGDADGTIYGAVPDQGGTRLVLDGDDDYVDLPNGILSAHTSVTIEAWVVWEGTAVAGLWQRIWDFGTNSAGELLGPNTNGATYSAEATTHFHLSPQINNGDNDVMRLTMWPGSSGGETLLLAPAALPTDELVHVAVVYDPPTGRAAIYQDGELLVEDDVDQARMPLSQLDDVNCFLGRSNYSADDSFDGALDEVRIYDHALTADEISLSFARGPDAPL